MKTTYQIRVDDNLHDAYQMVCDENSLSMSEVTRRHMREVVEEGRDALSEDQLRQVEIEKIKREGKEQSSDARKRINVTERVKEMFKQPYSADEIAKDIESYIRVDELEGHDERARYIRGLVEMAHLFRDYDEWEERQELPPSVFAAIDAYGKKYPEEHIQYLEELAEKADMEMIGYAESEEMSEEESQAIKDAFTPEYENEGGAHNLICDGGVDVRETFEMDGETFEIAPVRQRIRDQIDIDAWHGVASVNRTSGAIHLTVCYSSTWGSVREDATVEKMPVLVYQNLTFDTDEETVALGDLIWLPQDADVAGAVGDMSRRARADMLSSSPVEEPLCVDADDEVDVEALMDRSIEVPDEDRATQDNDKMRSHPGISPERSWGYGGGPPPEIERVVDRLDGAGLDPEEHLFRLTFGKKEPFDTVDKSQSPPSRGHSVDELAGNYGIDCLSRDVGLVCVDVDYPEEFPDEELPDTFSVSSPHGDDSQRHLLFLCDNKEELKDEVGAWSTQAPEWGDLWAGANRYVVGPGCQLSEYGCNEGEHEAGERGACERCESEDGGYYEIVNDAPIMAVSAERLASLVPDDEETEEAGNPVSTGETAEEGCVVADCCAAVYDEDEEDEEWMQAGNRVVCLGGCPHG